MRSIVKFPGGIGAITQYPLNGHGIKTLKIEFNGKESFRSVKKSMWEGLKEWGETEYESFEIIKL